MLGQEVPDHRAVHTPRRARQGSSKPKRKDRVHGQPGAAGRPAGRGCGGGGGCRGSARTPCRSLGPRRAGPGWGDPMRPGNVLIKQAQPCTPRRTLSGDGSDGEGDSPGPGDQASPAMAAATSVSIATAKAIEGANGPPVRSQHLCVVTSSLPRKGIFRNVLLGCAQNKAGLRLRSVHPGDRG